MVFGGRRLHIVLRCRRTRFNSILICWLLLYLDLVSVFWTRRTNTFRAMFTLDIATNSMKSLFFHSSSTLKCETNCEYSADNSFGNAINMLDCRMSTHFVQWLSLE